jgi:hypothetical protein
MSFESGTATNFQDLRDKLVTFLTTDSDLVAAGQEWEVVWTGSGRMPTAQEDIVLRGPGLAGADQVLVGLRSDPQPTGDRYNYGIRGVVGVNSSATNWDQHTNASDPVYFYCGNVAMPYWFIANGRRFIIVVRISSTYQTAYGGLFLPYAPPNLYPYPLAVGGCAAVNNGRYSDTGDQFHFFCDPGTAGNLKVLRYDNVWVAFQNWTTSDTPNRRNANQRTVAPWNPGWGTTHYALDNVTQAVSYRQNFLNKMQPAIGGDYALTPVSLVHYVDPKAILGVLQGVYHIPGFSISAESIITQDSKDYLCIPDIYREGNESYCAIELNGD